MKRNFIKKLDLNNIILWGHKKTGPFIILEGNHRWYNKNTYFPVLASVYVGLSNSKFELHSLCGCKFCEPGIKNVKNCEQ